MSVLYLFSQHSFQMHFIGAISSLEKGQCLLSLYSFNITLIMAVVFIYPITLPEKCPGRSHIEFGGGGGGIFSGKETMGIVSFLLLAGRSDLLG